MNKTGGSRGLNGPVSQQFGIKIAAYLKNMQMSNRSIPLVDLSGFVSGDEGQKQAFVDALGKAFHEVGFVGVINHQVPKDLIDGFYAASKAFFLCR